MTIRRALDAMLQSGAGSDAAEGSDASAVRAALDAAGFDDLPADLVGTAIGHYADTATVEQADALAPLATEASSIPFDPELDGPSESAGTADVDDDHDADPMDGLDADSMADAADADGEGNSDVGDALGSDPDADLDADTDIGADPDTDADTDIDADAFEYGAGGTISDVDADSAPIDPAASTLTDFDSPSTIESPGEPVDDPFDAFDTGAPEPTSWAERSELHTEDIDLDGGDPTADGLDDVDLD